MDPIVSICALTKTYASGTAALKQVDLEIARGEVLALLGPNGAGKTTLISIICGLVTPSSGSVSIDGHDLIGDYRAARKLIGLVPQELTIDSFSSVAQTVAFTRGLYGLPPDPDYIDQILKDLSLYDKRDSRLMALSGGMKRRVLIAKALAHRPKVLFLDEPTAGVDVALRKDMWRVVETLRDSGVTIILTTHYIEEAEEIADRVGVIQGGELLLIEHKDVLMQKLGKKQLVLELNAPLSALPENLLGHALTLDESGQHLTYTYDRGAQRTGITTLLTALKDQGITFKDLSTSESSLEEIFLSLLKDSR